MPLVLLRTGLVFFSLLVCGHFLHAQAGENERLEVNHIGTYGGMPSRVVHGSVFDDANLLWVGTDNGLCRLDGHGITLFHQQVQKFSGALRKDAHGLIYAVSRRHPDSVEIFDPVTLTTDGRRLGTSADGHFAGVAHQSGAAMYFARGADIYRFRPDGPHGKVHRLKGEAGPLDQLVFADEDGYLLYRRSVNQLELVNAGTVERHNLPTSRPVNLLHRDRAGNIFVSNREGLYRKGASETDFHLLPPLSGGVWVNFIREDEAGNLVLAYLDPEKKTVQEMQLLVGDQRLDANWIRDIENRILTLSGADFRNDFLISSYGGFYRVYKVSDNDSPFRRYLYRKLAPNKFGDVMRGFTADDEGNVYANKDSSMPYWFRIRLDDLGLDTITLVDNDGTVSDTYGCGTNMINYRGDIFGHNCDFENQNTFVGFVYRYRPADESWKRWRIPRDHEVIRWIRPTGREGELMVITEDKQTHEDGHLYHFYPERDSFALILTAGPEYTIHGYTKAALFDSTRNCLWIGTDRKFYRFDVATERLEACTVLREAASTTVSDILPWKNDKLLLSTFQHGILSFDPETGASRRLGGKVREGEQPPDDGKFLPLPANAIAAMGAAADEHLLVTTFNGMTLHGPEDAAYHFFVEEGLPNNEFNTASLFRNPHDGRWYAGGINGFVSFRTEDLLPKVSPYDVAMLTLRELNNGKGYEQLKQLPAKPTGPIIIPPDNLYFAFDFTIPDWKSDGVRRYQTFLENHDQTWTAARPENSVRYTDLKPGEYVFHVRAFDGEGRATGASLHFDVLVRAPWYIQPWFFGLCFLLLLGFLYYLHRRNVARIRKDMEADRKVQSLELRSLRQQMNPHFIANAMTAIRQFLKEETPRVSNYLNDFTLLMRSFLEASRRPFVPLDEEILMLERYIRLEALRFGDKFTWSIEVHPGIDRRTETIPSLLLQPIVENAINHGLFYLSSGGELRIRFLPDPADEEVLICTVSDNGVGRKIAAERKKDQAHISRSSSIIKDRLELITDQEGIAMSMRTTDLYPGRENTGTVVEIRTERG